MADFKPLPRNRVLGALSDYLSGARSLGDRVDLPLVGGLGSLLLGKSPEELDAWAYGDYPMYMPAQGNLPQFKPERDMQILDTAGAVPFLNTSAKFVRGLPSAVSRAAQEFAEASFAGAPGVVKRKGGNWDPSSIRDIISEIEDPIWLSGEALDEAGGPGTWNSIVRRGGQNDLHNWLRENEPELYDKVRGPKVSAADNWLNKQLTRYIQNDLATPDDPVRALAERGITHVPAGLDVIDPDNVSPAMRRRRHEAGFPAEGMGQTDLARKWEVVADDFLRSKKMGEIRRKAADPTKVNEQVYYQNKLEQNPWMAKLPDNENLYETYGTSNELGFDHLMDELRNAMDPESGLPPELLLRPESLARVSVPQAVERVAKINDWRAKQMELQRAARGPNPAEHLFKEYPEGYRWVQLKPPTVGPDDADNATARKIRENYLQEALKYEGDTMGHCVGGYCDDVAAGASNIFSLRDAKGFPHVTIETAPPSRQDFISKNFRDYTDLLQEGSAIADKWVREQLAKQPGRIVQIKGKQNKAPVDDYLPFVQDFVKSGQWSDVGDLRNTGLIKFKGGKTKFRHGGGDPNMYALPNGTEFDMPSGYMTASEAAQYLIDQGAPEDWARNHVGDFNSRFAEGGHVDLRALADQAYQEIQR